MRDSIRFFVLLLIFTFPVSGCAREGGWLIMSPEGGLVTELPESRNREEHCRSVEDFASEWANKRQSKIQINDKTHTLPIDKKAARKDFEQLFLSKLANFTPRHKRNVKKMEDLFERIIESEEFALKTNETVSKEIYEECMAKMANGTWMDIPPAQ